MDEVYAQLAGQLLEMGFDVFHAGALNECQTTEGD